MSMLTDRVVDMLGDIRVAVEHNPRTQSSRNTNCTMLVLASVLLEVRNDLSRISANLDAIAKAHERQAEILSEVSGVRFHDVELEDIDKGESV